jgi:hypothetical protein
VPDLWLYPVQEMRQGDQGRCLRRLQETCRQMHLQEGQVALAGPARARLFRVGTFRDCAGAGWRAWRRSDVIARVCDPAG